MMVEKMLEKGSDSMSNQELIRQRLLSERPPVQALLDGRIAEFFESPSQETFSEVCNAMVTAVVYGMNCHVPVEANTDSLSYFFVKNSWNEYAYVMCNTGDELIKCPSKESVVMPIRSLLNKVINDSDSRISGLVIDPYHAPRNFYLQLTRTNVEYILSNADALIDSQDRATRMVLKQGIS